MRKWSQTSVCVFKLQELVLFPIGSSSFLLKLNAVHIYYPLISVFVFVYCCCCCCIQ
uniref:Uncharacterized protein n=1 Tax=Rhizophora mucronata TaxID=61149 RepID=A0A2P2Q915_RHIMU